MEPGEPRRHIVHRALHAARSRVLHLVGHVEDHRLLQKEAVVEAGRVVRYQNIGHIEQVTQALVREILQAVRESGRCRPPIRRLPRQQLL